MSGIRDSFTCELEMRVDGVNAPHGYTPGSNVSCSDATKGLAQITFTDVSNVGLSDASGTPITAVWMVPHPTDNWKYIYPCVPGMGQAMTFYATMWGAVLVNGVLQRVHKKMPITIDSDGSITIAPPA